WQAHFYYRRRGNIIWHIADKIKGMQYLPAVQIALPDVVIKLNFHIVHPFYDNGMFGMLILQCTFFAVGIQENITWALQTVDPGIPHSFHVYHQLAEIE